MTTTDAKLYEDSRRVGVRIVAALDSAPSDVAIGALSLVVAAIYEETGDDLGSFDGILRGAAELKEAIKRKRKGQ